MSHLGPPGRGPGRDGGSIAIELVASIPLLVAAVIILIEGLIAVSGVNAVTAAARDGARAAGAGQDGYAAAAGRLPGWMHLRSVSIGPGAGCRGVCSRVEVGIPIGLPGFVDVTDLVVTRTADFPVG